MTRDDYELIRETQRIGFISRHPEIISLLWECEAGLRKAFINAHDMRVDIRDEKRLSAASIYIRLLEEKVQESMIVAKQIRKMFENEKGGQEK